MTASLSGTEEWDLGSVVESGQFLLSALLIWVLCLAHFDALAQIA